MQLLEHSFFIGIKPVYPYPKTVLHYK